MRRALIGLAVVALFALVGFLTAPANLRVSITLLFALFGVLAVISVNGFRLARRRLSLITSVAAVAVAWALAAGADAALSTNCPGVTPLRACTPRDVAAQAGLGLALPVVAALLALVARSWWRLALRTRSVIAHVVAVPEPKSSPTAVKRGRVTPKGTAPRPGRH